MEEPPAYALFLILTDNAEKLLPTVRSRCRELKLRALPREQLLRQLKSDFPAASSEDLSAAAERSGGWLGQARELLREGIEADPETDRFLEGLCSKDRYVLAQVLVPMEKWKREAFVPKLERWRILLEEALSLRSGGTAVSPLARKAAQARNSRDIYAAIGALGKAITYARSNVSVGAICQWLLWELE